MTRRCPKCDLGDRWCMRKIEIFLGDHHDVPCDTKKRTEETVKTLFDFPIKEKIKVKRDEVNPVGYYDGEHTKNVRDWNKDPSALWKWKWTGSDASDNLLVWRLVFRFVRQSPLWRRCAQPVTFLYMRSGLNRCNGWSGDSLLIPLFCLLLLR